MHSFIPLACAECDDSLPFSGASSIPLCYRTFPSTIFHQLVFHPPSLHLAIYFLVYLSGLLLPDSYIILFWGNSIFSFAVPSGRAVYGIDLRPLAFWDCGFETHRRHGCFSVVSVVCCQVEVSATSWSLVQRSPTDCGASLCVIKKPQEWGIHGRRWAAAPQEKKILVYVLLVYCVRLWNYIYIYIIAGTNHPVDFIKQILTKSEALH